MRRYKLSMFLLLLCWFSFLQGQENQIDLTFDDGETQFAPIQMNADDPSNELSVSDGILNIAVNKKVNDWSFLGLFGLEVDISANPYLKFSIKTDTECTFVVRVKTPNLSGGDDTQVQVQINPLTVSDEFQEFTYDLSDLIAGNADFDASAVKEVHIECTKGWNESFQGNVQVDYLKLGLAAAPPAGLSGTGYSQDFSDNTVIDLFTTNPEYGLSIQDEHLNINVNKNTKWRSFSFDLGEGFYDISTNPYANIKLKADKSFVMYMYVQDNEGNNDTKPIRTYYQDDFVNYFVDFSDANVNLSEIATLLFSVNGNTISYSGEVMIDDIKLGDEAVKFAEIGEISDKSYYINSGSHRILVTDINNASEITLSGGENLIENIIIAEIKDHYTTVDFDLISDSSGTAEVVLTSVGLDGYANKTISFNLTVTKNMPPEIDPVDSMQAIIGLPKTIDLSGIGDGDPSIEQPLTLSAMNMDTSILEINDDLSYEQGSPYGSFSIIPKKSGTDTIIVWVMDGEEMNDSTAIWFKVFVYESLNHPPVVNAVPKTTLYYDQGEQSISLTGLGDGDDGSQTLTITAESVDTSIIQNPVIVEYDGGTTATLRVTPNSNNQGVGEITINILDDGGTAGNDGNDSIQFAIEVETAIKPLTGYIADISDLTNDIANGVWGYPGTYSFSQVDSGDFYAIRVDCTDKFYWDGFNLVFSSEGIEMDLSENPYFSFEIYPLDDPTLHWIWFYDSEGYRNDKFNRDKRQWAEAGQWNKLFFDFSGEGDWINDNTEQLNGKPIDNTRIVRILFDMHNDEFGWPPPENYSGSFLIRNVRVGDEADIPEMTPVCTIDPVSDQVYFAGAGEKTIKLTGISNGADGKASVIALSSDESIASQLVTSDVNDFGEATLTLTPGAATGSATITIISNADGSLIKKITFAVDVVSDEAAQLAGVMVDKNTEYQTIHGFGAFYDYKYPDLYAKEFMASAVRIGLISNQIETENDNDDPYVLNREGLNYSGFDWEYFRKLKAGGVETFILTSWSPPAWMKRNLSLNFGEAQAPNYESTVNILEPYYFDEFAESMVAVIKMFKEEAGIDLYAIGIQNEPAFNEPYGSAVLSPAKFADLLAIVGKRFEEEGITTKLYMPEQVFPQTHYSMEQYIDSLQADPEAYQYTDIIAVHGYAADGIASGQPNFDEWTTMWENAREGDHPKELWMTETHRGFESWNDAMYIATAIHGSLAYGNISLWTQWSFEGQHVIKGEPTDMFYACQNWFKFVRPGAIRIDAVSDHEDLLVTAFKDAEDNIIIVSLNISDEPIAFELSGTDLPEMYAAHRTAPNSPLMEMGAITDNKVVVPAQSITTLVSQSTFKPTVDQLQDQLLILSEGEITINLTGITDGGEGGQSISVEAISEDTSIVKVPLVTYSSPDGNASLTLQPIAMGTTHIQVHLTDDGTANNAATMSFNVKIVSDINNKPTVDVEEALTINEDATDQTISLSNITDGDDGTQELTISVSSSNLDVVSDISVSDISDGTAEITFSPKSDVSGDLYLILNITDNGGTADNNGNQTIQKAVALSVLPVNDAPHAGTVTSVPNDMVNTDTRSKQAIIEGIDDGDPDVEQTITLTAESSDENIVGIDRITYSGGEKATLYLLSGGEAGTATITVYVKDDGGTENGGTDEASVSFNVDVATDINVSEISLGGNRIYPNPVQDVLNIKIENTDYQSVSITDLQGRVLMQRNVEITTGIMELQVSNLKQGIYMIVLSNQNETLKTTFIKR